ncbi:hypothetical protein J6TS2_05720 [Heyndrickxia sporothermodurans]|nr:hypothetical protein J6TS2_05720 [Heyndrickxia sporothermodurans]
MKKYDSPHLQRIYERGIRDGAELAKERLEEYFVERLSTLREVPGLGEKTIQKVIEHVKQSS